MTQNFSVDDSSPDPRSGAQIQYGVADQIDSGTGWTLGEKCSACSAQPDPAQAFDGTWHDASSPADQGKIPIASFNFTGIAVNVIGIIVSSTSETTGPMNNTRISFQIDDKHVDDYFHTATVGSDSYSYNVTFFAKSDLPNRLHNIVMSCGDGTKNSLCLLDKIIYTCVVEIMQAPQLITDPIKL
ncbi:hypothetical protein SCHPADRAFT_382577 [Schizopora paradoxa]|uniref:Uncharacterized protein n=1 Tax=Schizopora paradoxa TaxID=27342 RepID=A0A0H2RMJ2_9AGAM|nr:hypothetical protein SCHPADRAFT_382577 [Schizopora paradoxa]